MGENIFVLNRYSSRASTNKDDIIGVKNTMKYYQYKEFENLEPWLYSLCRCGFNEVNSDFHIYRKEQYPYSNIHFVNTGRFQIIFDNQVFLAKAGECFVLPGYKEHEYQVISVGNASIQWIEFYGSDSISLVERIIDLGNSPIISLGSSQNELSELLASMYSCKSFFSKSTSIYTLLMNLIKLKKEQLPEEKNQQGISFKDLIAYIEQYIDKPLKLNELCKHSGYSVSRLIELFKKEFNMTPKQYIYYRRINRVKKLLSNTDLSLDRIAENAGFYDSSHLIRRFKKQEGLTPKQYKKEIAQFKIR